jgi:hypothetical protein
MLNIYDGTLGSSVNVDKIIKALNNYLVMVKEPLNYEVVEKKTKVVIITGKNEQEKNLPDFQHPIVFKDVHNNPIIAIDLRLYMKQNLEDMINVSDYFSDRYNGNLQLNRLIFNKLMLDDDSFLLGVNNSLNLLFGNIISTIVAVMTYDKSLMDAGYLAGMLQYTTMDMDNIKDITEILDLLPFPFPKRLFGGNLTNIKDKILEAFENKELILPSKFITNMTHNLGIIGDSKRAKGITADMLVQSLSRAFFALNSKELSVAMCEHKPTYISIIYSVLTEGINNRSVIRKLAESKKSIYKTKDLTKILKDVIDDNIDKL